MSLTGTRTAFLLCAAAALAAGDVQAQAPAASTCGGANGTYATTDNNYRVEVTFAQGSLTMVEPNRSSTYTHVSGCTYGFTNPNNGIRYLMEVTPEGLAAFKPETPGNRTLLRRIGGAVASQESGSCSAEEVPVQNPQALHPDLVRLWGSRAIPGVTLTGTYLNEGTGRPVVELRADGTGVFEMHGAPQPQHVYGIRRWWVQANCDGTLVEQDYPAAKAYLLVIEYDRPYQGKTWDRVQLAVQKAPDGKVFILDRSKAKN